MARILLAEDDEPLREALTLFLESVGYEVVAFPSGGELLHALDTGQADIVITDLRMPGIDGLGILSGLRDRGSLVPVLVISGTGRVPSDMLFDRALTLGAKGTLEKPFDLAALQRAVERCLGVEPMG